MFGALGAVFSALVLFIMMLTLQSQRRQLDLYAFENRRLSRRYRLDGLVRMITLLEKRSEPLGGSQRDAFDARIHRLYVELEHELAAELAAKEG
jgi:hypothetical protein